MNTYNGWTESKKSIEWRTARRNWASACDAEGLQYIAEHLADELHELIDLSLTDPAHDRYSPEAEQEHQDADYADWMQQTEALRHGG